MEKLELDRAVIAELARSARTSVDRLKASDPAGATSSFYILHSSLHFPPGSSSMKIVDRYSPALAKVFCRLCHSVVLRTGLPASPTGTIPAFVRDFASLNFSPVAFHPESKKAPLSWSFLWSLRAQDWTSRISHRVKPGVRAG